MAEMAQPSGYHNTVPSTSDPEDHIRQNLVPNGQPPQWAKSQAFTATKVPRPPLIYQPFTNSSAPIASNGTPTPQNYSNPGSLSSHSSRNPSPTPSTRLHNTRQSLENLSHSNPNLNSHPPQSRVPPQQSSDLQSRGMLSPSPLLRSSQTLPSSVSSELQYNSNSQGNFSNQYARSNVGTSNSQQVGLNKTLSSSETPMQNPHPSSQNIPSQVSSEDHRGGQVNHKDGVSSGRNPNAYGRSSLISGTNTSYTSQVYTQPIVAPQASLVNGPQQHIGMHPPSLPGIIPAVPRTNAQGTLPPVSVLGQSSGTRSQPLNNQSSASMAPPSVNSTPVMSHAGQSSGMNPGVIKPPIIPLSHHASSEPGSVMAQYPGMPPRSSPGPGQSISYSGVPPRSSPGPTQVPGVPLTNHATQFPGMATSVPPGPTQLTQQTSSIRPNQPARHPGLPPSSQSTHYPGMLPSSGSGYYQPPSNYPGLPPTSSASYNQPPSNYPGMLPGSSGGYNQPPSSHHSIPPTSSAGYNQPPSSLPAMPPPSASGYIQPLSSRPGMPPTSASGYNQPPSSSSGIPPPSASGYNQPSNSSPGIPPPSASGYNQPPSSSPVIPPTSASGYNQPPSSRPGMLPTSASGYNQPPSSSSGIPPPSASGYNQPPSSSSGIPPPSASGYNQPPSIRPGVPPSSVGYNQPPSSLPSMPPTSASYNQPTGHPGIPPAGPTGMPPASQSAQYANMPPTTGGVSNPTIPPSSQYPGMMSAPTSGYVQPGMPPIPNSGYPSGDASHLPKRYPQQPGYPQQNQPGVEGLSSQMSNMSVTQSGFNKLWGLEYYDLLQTRHILPPERVEPPKVQLHQEFLDNVNCSSDIFRCTLTKIPESNSLLQKSRLPLGILVHPFKDLNHLPVIQCSTIVRCRACRTYINPFVYFVDHKRWKCNLCFRVNELPEEFQYDPVSKTYGDPTRRPEIKSSTMEFIAPSEYMLRPPQPAVYLFLLDVSQLGVESGYLQMFCDIVMDELDRLPGDGRTQVGFITYDSHVHFYNLAEGLSQPQQMIVVDTDDIFLPCPDNLLTNLAESRDLVRDLLHQLPLKFQTSHDTQSALGPALQAAYKLMSPTGGRVTVFQACLPTVGPGSLTSREDPSQRAGKEAPHLNPAIDFYKRLALDCSGQQVAVDLFIVNSQYCDLATISGVSRFSGGCIHHFPLFKASNILQAESFERVFRRYLTRKVGFEAVMRIRCSRGLAIHTFHGNFFVRSTDLLSLPNVNPDAGFGMQVSVEESLSEVQNVCFQAALLYTTSKGERRIRVHTLCLPVATTLPDILHSADQQCIIGLLAKMAVDRSHQASLSDAREAFINVAIDVLSAYRLVQSSGSSTVLLAPHNLRLLPLYILALLKYVAFRSGQSTRLDDRLFAMCQMKTLPLNNLIQTIYPDLYPVHCLEEQLVPMEDGSSIPQPPRLHLSAEKLDLRGVFLLDTGDHVMLYVGRNVSAEFCAEVLGVPSFTQIPEEMYDLPMLENTKSENLRNFINHLQSERPFCATLEVIRDDSPRRAMFTERLIEDRTESALSYYEFLQHLRSNVK